MEPTQAPQPNPSQPPAAEQPVQPTAPVVPAQTAAPASPAPATTPTAPPTLEQAVAQNKAPIAETPAEPAVAEPPQPTVAEPTAAAAPPVDSTERIPSFSWQASEFIHHQKNAMWYVGFVAIVLVLIGVAVVTHQWFSVAVFIAMAAALMVYARKEPQTLTYNIDDGGITIGSRLYKFNQFRSFSVIADASWHTIDLDPTQRFMPRLSILFDNDDKDTIVNLLAAKLPRLDRQPDVVERISRTIRF